ncbi:hypothetical protein AAT17_12505 [Nonlabens sp. MIC269]|uniref:hypothetical protein n=1 Tax=Nonlabens sp. MIC269 TaxID=1476901 RepID=UPI00071ECEF6|nr:hypothetical protein [Nonlabens sp. MIC269]ALM21994.1 hypothetical protein AAT17_12505 [Nonlabens sp. MIC269]
MISIETFKDELTAILVGIDEKIDTIKSQLYNNKKPIDQFIKGISNIPGVYAFFIKPKSPSFKTEFEDIWLNNEIKKYPKVVKSRFNNTQEISDGFYTFYLGKSEKVDSRVHEHIFHGPEKTTFSLKLNARKNFLIQYELYYSKFEFPELAAVPDKAITQFIITRIESQLRNKMNPWVGKQ